MSDPYRTPGQAENSEGPGEAWERELRELSLHDPIIDACLRVPGLSDGERMRMMIRELAKSRRGLLEELKRIHERVPMVFIPGKEDQP